MRDPFSGDDTIAWDRIPEPELSRWYQQQRLTAINHPRASIPPTSGERDTLHVLRSTDQVIPAVVATALSFTHAGLVPDEATDPVAQLQSQRFQAGGAYWDPATPTRVYVTSDALYQVYYNLTLTQTPPVAGAYAEWYFTMNGTGRRIGNCLAAPIVFSGINFWRSTPMFELPMTKGSYLELIFLLPAAALADATNLTALGIGQRLTIRRVSA